METIFAGIYNYFAKNKAVLYVVFFISLGLFAFFALRVKFEEDISAIIPKDKKTEKLNQVFQNSKFADKLVLTVSLKDTNLVQPDSLTLFADTLVAQIEKNSSAYVKSIHYKVDEGLTMELFQTIQQDYMMLWQCGPQSSEGKKPSFFEDIQYLWVGPLFVLSKLFEKIGVRW